MGISTDLFDPCGTGRSPELRTDEHSVRVLLVEDSVGCAELVLRALDHAARGRFEIDRVERMASAAEFLEPDRYDALLVDLAHLDIEPSATLDTVSELAHRIPVIVLTGTQDTELGKEALVAGDDAAEEAPVLRRFDRADLPSRILAEIKRHRRVGSQGSGPLICRIPGD
jgi:DNA-binding response OmpR family regulator